MIFTGTSSLKTVFHDFSEEFSDDIHLNYILEIPIDIVHSLYYSKCFANELH